MSKMSDLSTSVVWRLAFFGAENERFISSMKTSDVAKATGYSVSHIRRLATARLIPGWKTTKGGHHHFPDTRALRQWIGRQKNKKPTRHFKAQLREASRARCRHVRRDHGLRLITIESVLGVPWASWRRNVFLKQLDSAGPERLKFWLDHLREPYLAYLEVERRLAVIKTEFLKS